ncbi:MAG: glycosyl hydrolase family 18 protein [Intestinibacillus sp.]
MRIHTVQSGDSVYAIARQYNVPMERIISDNELTDPSRLVVGQTLVIRQPTQYHIVEPGESLPSIAAKYGMTTTQLLQLNPALNGLPMISPGQVLIIGLDQMKQGDLAVNAYAYPGIDRDTLRKTLPYLTYLSLFSYGFTPEGDLLSIPDDELIQLARDYGVAPIMVLTTLGEDGTFSPERAHALLNDPAAQTRLIENLARTLQAKGYHGVDFDFEYIPAEDKDAYAEFIQNATNRMNQLGLEVMVSLAPKTSANQPGLLYEAHDYSALGNAANDALIMTYEWGYSRGDPQPVAPINKVRQVIDYAKTEIPANKIMMGIPNYGYNWTLPYVPGQSVARSLSNTEAVQEALQNNAAIVYDWTVQSPGYTYWRDRAQHQVWFEDARSMRAKLDLAAEEGLRGVNIWTIMNYFPQLFLVLSSLYNIKKVE